MKVMLNLTKMHGFYPIFNLTLTALKLTATIIRSQNQFNMAPFALMTIISFLAGDRSL